MFQPWRVQLRQAEDALRSGRLDEAQRLLNQGNLREFLPARRLAARLAHQFAARGQDRAARGETAAGWHDLAAAAGLGATAQQIDSLRERLRQQALDEVTDYLRAGDPAAALARLDAVERQLGAHRRLRELRQLTRHLDAAQRYTRRGKLGDAQVHLAAAQTLAPREPWLAERHRECVDAAAAFRELNQALHRAIETEHWNEALALAEQLLATAPEYQPARDARRRAWAVVGTELADSARPAWRPVAAMPDSPRRDARGGEPDAHPPQPAQPPLQQPAQPPRQPVGSQPASAQIDAGWSADRGQRLWLWIDAVGGYLVCRGTSVTLGAPSGHGEVDVPILGDVSRRHARIRRDEEGYVIEAAGSVSINGRPVASAAALVDGDQIDLGGGVRLAFTRPHALSGSARLDFVSRHRTQPPADAVLLMADSLVLGPGPTTHVRCPDWSADVVLFGAGDALACRAVGEFQIDGEPCTSRGQLHGQAHVTGEDFSFSLEAM